MYSCVHVCELGASYVDKRLRVCLHMMRRRAEEEMKAVRLCECVCVQYLAVNVPVNAIVRVLIVTSRKALNLSDLFFFLSYPFVTEACFTNGNQNAYRIM